MLVRTSNHERVCTIVSSRLGGQLANPGSLGKWPLNMYMYVTVSSHLLSIILKYHT